MQELMALLRNLTLTKGTVHNQISLSKRLLRLQCGKWLSEEKKWYEKTSLEIILAYNRNSSYSPYERFC